MHHNRVYCFKRNHCPNSQFSISSAPKTLGGRDTTSKVRKDVWDRRSSP